MTRYDILIPGDYFCDLIFTGFPRFPALGSEVYTNGLNVTIGGALNTVIALHRLGVKVGWIGCVGTDIFSRYVLDIVQQEGIDTSLLRHVDAPFQRVTVSVSYPHDRAFITYVDPVPTALDVLLEQYEHLDFGHLHFTGFELDPSVHSLLATMRARSIPVSMDCQDRPITLDTPGVRDTLSALSLFMPNAREAMQLTGADTLDDAAPILAALVPQLVIKDGANGALAWRDGGRIASPSIPVTVVDTTGAGDVFNAGFLCAYLDGKPLADCLRWGNICGGLSTQGHGGTSTAPTRAEVDAYAARG